MHPAGPLLKTIMDFLKFLSANKEFKVTGHEVFHLWSIYTQCQEEADLLTKAHHML